jgi:hypothetical protein
LALAPLTLVLLALTNCLSCRLLGRLIEKARPLGFGLRRLGPWIRLGADETIDEALGKGYEAKGETGGETGTDTRGVTYIACCDAATRAIESVIDPLVAVRWKRGFATCGVEGFGEVEFSNCDATFDGSEERLSRLPTIVKLAQLIADIDLAVEKLAISVALRRA